jgi:hypothetical protein
MSPIYQIKIESVLSESWLEWFDSVTMTIENGTTTLTGAVDQSALHGILFKIRDLNLELISVNQINPHISGGIHDKHTCTCWQPTEGWEHGSID